MGKRARRSKQIDGRSLTRINRVRRLGIFGALACLRAESREARNRDRHDRQCLTASCQSVRDEVPWNAGDDGAKRAGIGERIDYKDQEKR